LLLLLLLLPLLLLGRANPAPPKADPGLSRSTQLSPGWRH